MNFARRLIGFSTVILLAVVWCYGQTSVQIKADRASAREAPSGKAKIVAKLPQGTVLTVIEDVPYWYGVKLKSGEKAYVAKSLCSVLVDDTTEEKAAKEVAGPLDELYPVPTAPATISLPACKPAKLDVDWNICSTDGGGGANHLANEQKNRVEVPCRFVPVTVDDVLALKNLPRNVRALDTSDERIKYLRTMEARAVVLEGYLAMVKRSEPEDTNCKSKTRRDIHMEIVGDGDGDPKEKRRRGVVTEVTPWFSEKIEFWTHTNLCEYASYCGGYSGAMRRKPAKVRMYGWQFFDNWHAGDGSVGTWRGTAWEVHPITRIEVWQNGSWQTLQ